MGSPAGPVAGCARGLVLALVPALLQAAPPARFTRLTTEHGLSQNTVQAILQDHVGFLWFGTDEGLDRFDGYAFVAFRHDPHDPRSLPDDVVSALHEDRQHRLWVGTQRGLSFFDRETETFTRIPSVRERVNAILEDPDGTLWVGTEGEGLFERNPASGAFTLHQHDDQDPDSLATYIVSALLRDRRGRLWIATRNAGVDRLEKGNTFVHHRHDPRDPRSLGHDEVWGLAEDAAGDVWVGTYGDGLSVLDHEVGTFRHYSHDPADPGSLSSNLVTSVFMDRSGTLWVGTDGTGLQRFDFASRQFVGLAHDPADLASLSQNVVRSIYEDGQGQLWVGTYLGGVNLLKKPRHAFGYSSHTGDASSLADPSVASFLEDAQGRLWVGTERGWLHRYDPEKSAFVRYRIPGGVPGGSAVLSLHQDRRGRLWLGTYRSGLMQFDPASGRFVVYRHRPGDERSLTNDDVWAMAEDDDGTLWLGTNAGVDRFDPDAGAVTRHYQTPTTVGIGGDTGVRALHVDRHGNLWAGTVGGLDLLLRKEGGFVHYRHDEGDQRSLSHDVVVALHEDREGRIWVGTLGGGAGRLDPVTGKFDNYKSFPSNVVYGIQEDAQGRLWLSTNHGLSRLYPGTGSVDSFDLTSGLQSLQFHLGASLRTRNGRLLFGSVDGLYDFDPESIRPDTFAPPVVFTALRVFNEPVKLPRAISVLQEVTLSQKDKVFSLEFAALDYALPRRNQYAYTMEGFSDQWIPLGGRRDVTFTNLDPGTYRFRVKASNSDAIWSDASAAALQVVIRPHFWRAWWFEGAAVALAALALLAVHRARVRHLTAEIAARKLAEAALSRAEEKYRSMFENAVEGMFQSTPDGRFLTVNPALARMLGYASPEQIMDEVTDIERQLYVAPGRRRDLIRAVEEQGAAHGLELQVRCRDGRVIWVSGSLRVVRDEAGKVLYYEGSSEEIAGPRRVL